MVYYLFCMTAAVILTKTIKIEFGAKLIVKNLYFYFLPLIKNERNKSFVTYPLQIQILMEFFVDLLCTLV